MTYSHEHCSVLSPLSQIRAGLGVPTQVLSFNECELGTDKVLYGKTLHTYLFLTTVIETNDNMYESQVLNKVMLYFR
jgi:hypothetical protein